MAETIERNLDRFEKEINEVEEVIQKTVFELGQAKREYYWIANEVEWHVNGLIYHFRKIYHLYTEIVMQIAARAMTPQRPDVLVFHSPEMQALLFEFYALVTLSRITLDHITQNTLAPLFRPGTLPGSVNDFLKGTSDIELHRSLSQEPSVRFLIDVRDCMVHHRTFATSNNTIAMADGVQDDSQLSIVDEYWKYPIVRTYFRVANDNKIVVNLLLPDAIYEYDANGNRVRLLRNFEYSERRNVLRYSMDFIQICGASTVESLRLLQGEEASQYTWSKRGSRVKKS